MKFVHVSDLHIGKRVNGMPMIDDQRHILAQVVQIARDRNVDALVIAGDIYDKASPSAEAVSVFDAFLTEVASCGIRVLAVPGNHDSAERIAFAQELLAAQGVCFPPVFDGSVRQVELADEFGPVSFWLLPFLKPGDVRRFFPHSEIGDDYAAALAAAIGTCQIDPAQRNVAVSHQLVTAAGAGPDRADEEIKLGGIDNVDVSAYAAFDYVALGHVHRAQRVGRDTVRYSGSPLKYSFGEARYGKKALVVELGAKSAGDEPGACVQIEPVPLEPLHDLREVRGELADLLAQEPSGDYLHVTLTDEHPQLDAMSRIRAVFPNAMTLDYEASAMLASLGGARSVADPDRLDAAELFAQFYEEQAQKPLDDAQEQIVRTVAAQVERELARGEAEAKGGAR